MRTIKDDSATDAWEDWSGMEIFNDEGGVNWKAFVAAQETDATGTVTLKAGTTVIGKWEATRILEWVAISSSRGSSQPRNGTRISHFTGGFFTTKPSGGSPQAFLDPICAVRHRSHG